MQGKSPLQLLLFLLLLLGFCLGSAAAIPSPEQLRRSALLPINSDWHPAEERREVLVSNCSDMTQAGHYLLHTQFVANAQTACEQWNNNPNVHLNCAEQGVYTSGATGQIAIDNPLGTALWACVLRSFPVSSHAELH